MPYGVEVKKLDSVYLGNMEIAVYPAIMKMLDLKPGQAVDDETAQKIIAENEKLLLAK
jgi:hypothetical protein